MATLREALRSILHTPAFAAGAVLTFALGIGVNVAVFSAVDRVLFRPLPFDHPERLVVMTSYRAGGTEPELSVGAPYVLGARQAPAVEELTVSALSPYRFRFIENADDARYVAFVPMAYTALTTLGVHPVIGSDFTEEDARLKRRLALVTYETWQRQFGGRSDAIGRRIWGSDSTMVYEIAGVLPPDFIPPQLRVTEPWSGIALSWQVFDATTTNKTFTPPFIRLRPDISIAQAQAQMDAIAAGLGPVYPAPPGGPASVIRLQPLRDALFGRYATYVALTFAAATLVLMVGCANLASLLLVRARARDRRAAIQVALGASPNRLMKAALAEALLLAGSGAALAIVVIQLAHEGMSLWLPPVFASYGAPVLETRLLLFSLAAATVSALAAGALPGWRTSRVDLLAVLQRDSRAGSGRLRGSGPLLVIEIALSTVLVLGAVLMGRTLTNLKAEDVGFEPDQLFTVSTPLAPADKPVLLQQYNDMLAIIRQMPGVQTAAGADTLPMIGAINRPMFLWAPDGSQRCPATAGLVETLGMHVIAGRTFSTADVQTMAPIGMLSLEGLKSVWPGVTPQEAIGRFLAFSGEAPREVIGVVSDVRFQYNVPAFPSLYVPIGSERFGGMLFAVRVKPGHTLTVSDLTRELKTKGYAPRTVRITAVADSFASGVVDQVFRARLFAGFGVVTLLLAMIGVYAVQSFAVTQRRAEFGIRVALGATRGDLWRLLIRDTMRPAIIGVLFGLVVAYWASQFFQAFLYGMDARDPMTFGGVALLLLTVAAAAVWLPARRASRTDPAVVLRTTL
jgi:predicted permease